MIYIEPTDTTEATSTIRLRQKLKRDKIVSLYRCLSVTGDPGLEDLDRFMIRKNLKTGNIELLFLDGSNQWQSLTNECTGEFLAAKTLREKFGGLNIMKSVLSLDETPSALERSVKAATKFNCDLPTDLEVEGIPLKLTQPDTQLFVLAVLRFHIHKKPNFFLCPQFFCLFFFHLLTYANPNILMDAKQLALTIF